MNANELLARMTREEKAALLTGADTWHIKNCPRLSAAQTMVSDGPHGLRKQLGETDNMGFNGSKQAVCFPCAAGLASSFDRDLLKRLGKVLGTECRAEHLSILLGPAVNIKRSPLCGRNFEYFSEDPFLAGELAAGYVNGLQGEGVGASLKHFAANNQEYRRMSISAVVDERALRELYLSAFETVVKKAKPWTVMCSYNKINGTYSSENDWLLNKVLRNEWGFEGYVMTDWGAAADRVKGVAAGCDLEMPSSAERNTKRLLAAVENGTLEQSAIDCAAGRILRTSLRTLELPESTPVFDTQADHEIARQIARECMVLLKNENHLLPLSPGQNIAFLGAFAEKPRYQGGGSSHINPTRVTGALPCARERANIRFAKGYDLDKDEPDETLLREAAVLAAQADVAVVFVGLTDKIESEGYDRKTLSLTPAHNALVEAVCKVQKNTVVVLHNGAPITMPWLPRVDAVLEAYLGGEAVGEAVADLLFGDANPCGKLAETFPLSLEDTPCAAHFPGNQLTVEYRESIYVGYRYYEKAEKEVLFPFGHGLSYTTFAYSDLSLSAKEIHSGQPLSLSFTVTNTGTVDGAEIVQLYVAPPKGDVFRPQKELKGFEKVFLHTGESKRITMELEPRSFSYYHVPKQTWHTPGGDYELVVGASSRDLRLRGTVAVLQKSPLPPSVDAAKLPSYYSGEIQNVGEGEFRHLLGRDLPAAALRRGETFTMEHCIQDARETPWGRRIATVFTKLAGEKYANYLEAVLTAPVRAIIASSGGLFGEPQAEALLCLLNRKHTLRSLVVFVKWAIKLKKRKKQ